MRGDTDETVGMSFRSDLLQQARDKTLAVISEAAHAVRPGMSEIEAKALILEIQTRLGAAKSWHPAQIRFGKNTLLSFGERSEEGTLLAENDIFFFDIGPIFDGHEGDVGRPFAVGDDPEMTNCCRDAEEIWLEVRDRWKSHKESGAKLYAFATQRAEARGWLLSLKKANGHRIADFPHAARARGSIEEFTQTPAADRWILEIQIRHPVREFGAFYEDLLN
jgi:Xaa-Pro aminopeptidase